MSDAVASIAEGGVLAPANAAMEAWVARFSVRFDELPLAADERARLAAGAAVVMRQGDEAWALARHDLRGRSWLTARDVSREASLEAAASAASRARALAELAASLAHDLNNQISAVMALSAELAFHVEGAEDQRAIRELEQGTKAGAAALTALAKMLVRTPARRDRVDAGALVEDAAALLGKAFEQRGVGLTWRVAAGLPPTRAVYVDILHSVTSVLRALLDRSPERVEVEVQLRSLAISGGRPRDCVACAAEVFFADAAASAALAGFAELVPDTLRAIGSNLGRGQEFVTAALLQRRLGGELRVEVEGARVTATFLWPAAR